VLLAAGEVQQRRGELALLHQAQIGSNPAGDDGGRLGGAAFDRLQDGGGRQEVLDDDLALPRRYSRHEVQVADGLAVPPQAAGDLHRDDRRMRGKVAGQSLRRRARFGKEVALTELLQARQPLQELLLALRSEPREFGDATVTAGAFECGSRVDIELLEEQAKSLRPQPRDAQKILHSGRELGAQLGEQRECPGEHDLCDAGDQSGADPADLAERSRLVEVLWVLRHPFDGAGAVGVGAAAKGVLPLEIEQVGDLAQNRRDLPPVQPRGAARGGRCPDVVAHDRRSALAGLSRWRPERRRRRQRPHEAPQRDRCAPRRTPALHGRSGRTRRCVGRSDGAGRASR
jgi:hypothetical protein